MAIGDLVAGSNLGAEFDQGTIATGEIRLKIGAGLSRAADGTISASGGNAAPWVPDWSALAPVTLTGDVDNWSPPATSLGWIVDMTGNSHQVTGLVAPSGGVQENYWIANLSAQGDNLKLKHEDTNSAAANRFLLPDAADYDMKYGTVVVLSYIPSLSRWVVVSEAKP